MRAYELYEYFDDLDAFWLNVNSSELVPLDEGMSHAFDVILHPKKYGFSVEELKKSPISAGAKYLLTPGKITVDDLPDLALQFDGDPSILKFMTKQGWVRIVIDDVEINITAFNIKQAVQAARILIKKYPKTDIIRVDLTYNGGESYESDTLTGKRLDLFLRNGAFPSKNIVEHIVVFESFKSIILDAMLNDQFVSDDQKYRQFELIGDFSLIKCSLTEAFNDRLLQHYIQDALINLVNPKGPIALLILEAAFTTPPTLEITINERNFNFTSPINRISDKTGVVHLTFSDVEDALQFAGLLKLTFSDRFCVTINNKLEQINESELSRPITQQDLDSLESKLDQMYSVLGLDVEFTKHFLDRVNDRRNQQQVTIEELFKIFQETLKVHGKKIAQAGPDFEAIMNDISTALNIPFVLNWNKQKNELEIISKTIMRKDNFMSSDPKFVVGKTSKKRN